MSGRSGTLTNLRVLNTRPLEQGKSLSQAILRAGGQAIDFPLLTIEPTTTDWVPLLPNLQKVHQAIFISTNAVQYFYTALKHHQLSWPSSIQTTAIGKTSAAALVLWKITPHHTPAVADSDHVLALPSLRDVQNQTILLIKGEGGRSIIANELLTRGAHVIALDVYRRILPSSTQEEFHSLWHDNAIDIILFTSEQSIKNLLILSGDTDKASLCKTPCLVLSDRLAEAARRMGMQTIIVSRYDTIISSLEDFNKGRLHDHQ